MTSDMKIKFLIVPAFLLIGMTVFSQQLTPDKVPAGIRQVFTKNFPAAKSIQYHKEKDVYIAAFLMGDKQCAASIDATGKLIETERGLDAAGLPLEVRNAVKQKFSGYTIMDAVRREAIDKGVCYEMDLKKDHAGFQVRFSPKGEILMKVAMSDEVKIIRK